jgi:predicted nucleic acid-binding protein
MASALFDTSVYISELRRDDQAILALRNLGQDGPLWLSSVVLAELYAGAGIRERRAITRLEENFTALNRVAVPNLNDWAEAGRTLARLTGKYHYESIGRTRLLNDALIAISARRLGICVFTENERDYRRIAEFRPFQWKAIKS